MRTTLSSPSCEAEEGADDSGLPEACEGAVLEGPAYLLAEQTTGRDDSFGSLDGCEGQSLAHPIWA